MYSSLYSLRDECNLSPDDRREQSNEDKDNDAGKKREDEGEASDVTTTMMIKIG
jgi:hypothetical protein